FVSYTSLFVFLPDSSPTVFFTLSLHDALPILPFGFFFCMYFSWGRASRRTVLATIVLGAVFSLTIEVLQWYIPMRDSGTTDILRSEEHTSELQSRRDLVCRLLLEKKKTTNNSQ